MPERLIVENMTDKKKSTTEYINIAVSAVLTFLLLSLYIYEKRSLSHFAVLIVLTLLISIFTKSFRSESVFRTVAAEIAFLPYISFHIDLGRSVFDFTGIKAFYQVCIMYSVLLRIYIPLFAVILLIVSLQKENSLNKKALIKYFPFTAAMLILFIVSAAFNPLADVCFFGFAFIATAILRDMSEKHIYRRNDSLLTNLPFYFLFLTAIYRMLF